MGKMSVFKFNIGDNSIESNNIVIQIIEEYLSTRGFYYNSDERCYWTGAPTKGDIATNVGLAVGSAVLSGGTRVVMKNTAQRGFEYQIVGNQLIIKAYLGSSKSKQYIHSTFNNSKAGSYYYADLTANLFKKLLSNNITLLSKEIEKINDGSETKTFKVLLFYFLGMFLIIALVIFLLF